MDYEAYLDAFQAELNYKPKAPAFGHPPAAGGIGGARKASRQNSENAPLTDEKIEAMAKAKGAAKKVILSLKKNDHSNSERICRIFMLMASISRQ